MPSYMRRKLMWSSKYMYKKAHKFSSYNILVYFLFVITSVQLWPRGCKLHDKTVRTSLTPLYFMFVQETWRQEGLSECNMYRASCPVTPFISQILTTALCTPNHTIISTPTGFDVYLYRLQGIQSIYSFFSQHLLRTIS